MLQQPSSRYRCLYYSIHRFVSKNVAMEKYSDTFREWNKKYATKLLAYKSGLFRIASFQSGNVRME